MISTTPLLAHLAKSGTKTNLPEGGDTRIQIPGIISPTLEIPFPFFTFYSTPQNPLVFPVNSWFYSEQNTFNVGTGPGIFIGLGPGLWDLTLQMTLQEAAAISDPTNTVSITCFPLDGTGATVEVLRLTNKQGLNQSQQLKYRQMVTSDQTYVFSRSNVAGLGTGLNLFDLKIIGVRLF